MRFRIALVASSLLGATTVLYAHELYIKLDNYFLEPNSPVTVPIVKSGLR